MDIEENGRSESSNDPNRDEFHAEDQAEYEATIDRKQIRRRKEKRDDVAERARKSLRPYDFRLGASKVTHDTVRLLKEMKQTYAGSFKPRDVSVYIRCRYYLWRIKSLDRNV